MRKQFLLPLALFCCCLLSLARTAHAQLGLGLYKDGQLIEQIAAPVELADAETQALAGIGNTNALAKLKAKAKARQVRAPELSPESQARNAAFARASKPAAEIRKHLREMKSDKTGDKQTKRSHLRKLLEDLTDTHAEVQQALAQTATRIQQMGLDPIILERHRQTVEAVETGQQSLTAAVSQVVEGHDDALDQAIALADQVAPAPEPDLTKASPTVQTFVQPAPEMTREEARASFAPAAKAVFQPQNSVSPPTTNDLRETPEIQFSPDIVAKATSLGHSPLAIYEFVRNQFKFEPYLGSRKGADETLRQRKGNDTDQASLLMALLRTSGIPCRYARGMIELTPERAKKWLGVDDARTGGSILTTAGLEGVNIVSGTNVLAIQCRLVWVEAYVPYANYRGVPNDNSGKAWVPLVPCFKDLNIIPGQDVLAQMGMNVTNFLASYVATPALTNVSPLEHFQAQIQSWLDTHQPGTNVADIERRSEVAPQNLGLLPASLPFDSISAPVTFSELEDSKRYKVRFRLYDGGATFIDYTTNLSHIISKRVTIEYVGSTPAYQATIDSYGGIYQTPPYLVRVKPVLQLDDVPVAISANDIGAGYQHSSDMHFIQPTGDNNVQPVVANDIIAGNGQAIAFDTFLDVRDTFLLGAGSTNLLKTLLYSTAVDYLNRVDRGQEKAGALLRVITTEDVSEAIVENSVKVTYSFGGVPQTFEWTGLIVDADRRIIGTFPVDGNDAKQVPFMLLSGYDGSSMENRVFEDTYDQEAVSTIKVFHVSGAQGVPLCYITNSIASACPGFSHSSSIISAVTNALAQGHIVIIPRSPITYGQWSGTGYIDLDPTTGAAGYIISGGINGNVMVSGGATVASWEINFGNCQIIDFRGEVTHPSANSPDPGAVFCGTDQTDIGFTGYVEVQCQNDQPPRPWRRQDLNAPSITPKYIMNKAGPGHYDLVLMAIGQTKVLRKISIVGIEFVTPAGDPVGKPVDGGDGSSAPDGANEFTYSTANPGVLTLRLKAKVIPAGLANVVKDRFLFAVSSMGSSVESWAGANPNGKPTANGDYLTAEYRCAGLPAQNAKFGAKQVTLTCAGNEIAKANFEVFWPLLVNLSGSRTDGNFAKNHPGGDLAATASDTGGSRGASTRAPNWFYYWRQTLGTAAQNTLYDSTDLAFGETPAVFSFARAGSKGPYTGPHNRILIEPLAQGTDTTGGTTTGIDAFRDTVLHENIHAIDQSVGYTTLGFGLSITGSSNVRDDHWSFNIPSPVLTPTPPLPAGRVYNHYRDSNADGDFLDAGEDLDTDGDSVINSSEPGSIESLAEAGEPNNEDGLASQDWGNPGKNHSTRAFND